MIHVLAILTARPGKRAELLAAIADNLPRVRAEQGCIEYGPVVDAEAGGGKDTFGPDVVVIIEKWATAADLKAHAAAPHMLAYGDIARPLLADRRVHVLDNAL